MRLRSAVCAALIAAGMWHFSAAAQEPAGPEAGSGADQGVNAGQTETLDLEQVVVTGSRLPQDGFSSPVPLSVVDRDDIMLSGAPTIELVLNSLPQFIPANNARTRLGSGAATFDLRGLGESRTLVLVNSRRYLFFDPTQVTDVNTIPAALIDRVEIVTGGSSAVYGSDAIAGVVNFILRDDFEGVEVRAQVNSDAEGDGPTRDFNLTAGGNLAGGRGNAVVSVNYFKRDAIFQSERGFPFDVSLAEGQDAEGNPALVPSGSSNVPFGRFSGIPSGAQLDDPQFAGLREALDAAGLGGLTSQGFISDESGMNARPFERERDGFNTAPFSVLQRPQERWVVTGLTHYDLNARTRGYLEAAFSHIGNDETLAPVGVTGTFQFDIDNPFLSPEMQAVFRELDPIDGSADGLATLSIGRRLMEVGTRRREFRRDAWRVNPGVEVELGDVSDRFLRNLRFDASYMFAETDTTVRFDGAISVSRFREGLLRPTPNQDPLLNIFGPNISPEGAESIKVAPVNQTDSRLQVAMATFGGDLFDLPAGTVPGSFGFEWRKAEADFIPDDFVATGDVTGTPPQQPTSGDVKVWELFGEIRVPLLKGLSLVEELNAGGGFRYSDYDLDGVGSVWTYFGSGEWVVNPGITFRGQFQRAIRAPNVGELFGGQVDNNPFAVDPCAQAEAAADPVVRELCIQSGVPAPLVGDPGVQPNNRIDAISGGNPDLTAETSDTFTMGAVFQPGFLPDLRFSVDYFDIDVEDAIAPLAGGVSSILNLCFNVIQDIDSEVCRAIQRNPIDGVIARPFRVSQLNANIGRLEVAGIDFQLGYDLDLDWGLLDPSSSIALSFNGTWIDKYDVTPLQDIPDEVNACAGAFGDICGEPRSRFKSTSRITWRNGPLGLSLRHRLVGNVTLDRILLPRRAGLPGPSEADFVSGSFDSQHYLDFAFTYRPMSGLEVFGGVNNLTDNDPPLFATGGATNVFASTYDPLGRELFLGFVARF